MDISPGLLEGWTLLARGTDMSAFAAKLVYGIGLFFLAAFAMMPQSQARMEIAAATASPLSTEDRLARAIHDRIALEATDRPDDAELVKLRATEAGLRRLAFEDNAPAARRDLISALADSLSAAMLVHADLADGGGDDTDALDRAKSVVRRLTAAINDEVRSLAT